ncbi:DUF3261 domain-containing protein [Ferrimonas senticii]|uniref:DUF3261 domain-containing protein n=1 Tax=Ferrimonas senticii TaxID=394566 RepID=UPI00041E9020|nr:DUF3261 domain-containing protein [Ferrimonas senticii]
MQQPHCGELVAGINYCLAQPSGEAQRRQQRIELHYPSGKLVLFGVEEQSPQQWVLAASGPLGQPSLSLRWDGVTLAEQINGLDGPLPPQWLLAMVQVMQQPDRLQSSTSHWRPCPNADRCQQLYQDQQLLLTVKGSHQSRQISHHPYQLTLTVTTLQETPL